MAGGAAIEDREKGAEGVKIVALRGRHRVEVAVPWEHATLGHLALGLAHASYLLDSGHLALGR